MNENFIEFYPLEGNTPEEILKRYTELMNGFFANEETVYSKKWQAMLSKVVDSYWIEEIKGRHFAMVSWKPTRYKSREEFLGEEETI